MTQNQTELDTSKCLVCENNRAKRGLCIKHYEQFRRRRDSLPIEQQQMWESRLIEANKLLPQKQGNRSKDDAFDEDFEEFLAEIERASNKQLAKTTAKKAPKTTKKKQA